jgi:hypothetical protein
VEGLKAQSGSISTKVDVAAPSERVRGKVQALDEGMRQATSQRNVLPSDLKAFLNAYRSSSKMQLQYDRRFDVSYRHYSNTPYKGGITIQDTVRT